MKVYTKYLTINTEKRIDFVNITSEVQKAIDKIHTNNDKMITGKEAMNIIGVKSYNTFRRIVDSGGLTPRIVTGEARPKFHLQEVIEFSKS